MRYPKEKCVNFQTSASFFNFFDTVPQPTLLVSIGGKSEFMITTVQNYMKKIISSLSDCTSPCLVLTKSPQISVQNKLLACSLEVIIEMNSNFLKNRDFCFGGKFKLVKII